MSDTARDLGVDPNDLAQNLDGSAWYLLMILDQFGDGALALASYNVGLEALTSRFSFRTSAALPARGVRVLIWISNAVPTPWYSVHYRTCRHALALRGSLQ